MPRRTRAEAFDEWMRAYIEDPRGFEAEFQTVSLWLQEQAAGQAPTYGQVCAAYLELLEEGDEEPGAVEPPPAPAVEL